MAVLLNASTSSGLIATPDTSGDIALQNNGTTAVTVTGGNVGIGTSSPNSPAGSTQTTLHINNASTGTSPGIHLTNGDSGSAAGDGTLIFMGNAAGTGTTSLNLYNQEAGPICLYTGTNERMRIDSSGNLLVNGTTVYAKQTVANNTSYNYASVSVGNNAEHFIFKNDATTVGSIARVGGTGVVYNTSSDYRLKYDAQPMQNALQRVALLKPVTYKWNLDDSEGEGFIAHELQELVPLAVSGEKDAVNEDGSIKPQGIDLSRVVPVLVKALQELKEELDATKAEVAALKGTA